MKTRKDIKLGKDEELEISTVMLIILMVKQGQKQLSL